MCECRADLQPVKCSARDGKLCVVLEETSRRWIKHFIGVNSSFEQTAFITLSIRNESAKPPERDEVLQGCWMKAGSINGLFCGPLLKYIFEFFLGGEMLYLSLFRRKKIYPVNWKLSF